jgi:hypothetical protein
MTMVVMVLLACTVQHGTKMVVEGEECNNAKQNHGENLVIIPVKGC